MGITDPLFPRADSGSSAADKSGAIERKARGVKSGNQPSDTKAALASSSYMAALIRKATFLLSVFLTLIMASTSFALDKWHPVSETSLEVAQGSVLDFSNLTLNEPAGSMGAVQVSPNGHFQVPGGPGPQRFLCASMVPGETSGGLPDKAEADRLVEQLKRTGYNLVRLHFIDAVLMTRRQGDFDFDPVGLDRLHYLMARLKATGIYWIVDGLTSDNGAYGNVQPHRWVNRHDLKERLFYDPAAMAHWKRLVTALWGGKNPYTGLAPLHDPAMLGMILVNEGGMGYLATLKGSYPKALQKQFSNWQVNHAGMANGKGGPGSPAEMPREIRGKNQAARDFAAFLAARESEMFREMDAHVRTRGFRGLTTAYDNFGFYHADVARAVAGWIDMHAYQSLPNQMATPGSKLAQISIFDDVGRYGRYLANARQWGKPFTVTEYGQPFWNQWRHETTGWIPALAAFQDWDAICQFAEFPVLLKYTEVAPVRRRAMYPFGIGADPIARGGERLAALLFLRGDVAPSGVRVKLGLNPKRVFADGYAWGQLPENLGRLALAAASGLDLTAPQSRPKVREVYFPLDAMTRSWMDKAENELLRRGILIGKDPIEQLKSSGLLSASNRSNLADGVFETDTGQMLFDAGNKSLSITTERTVVFTRRSGSAKGGGVELTALSSPATVAVGAVDGQAIARSRRLLVWVLTDAINTGMEFADDDRTTLKTLGHFPPQIRAVTGRLTIRHSEAAILKVWAVDQAGHRVAEVPARVARGVLSFPIDNVVPKYGPVTYFEVAAR